jgi:hypothetical protein
VLAHNLTTMLRTRRWGTCGRCVIVIAACVLGLAGTAGAANRISGDWNAGHGITCSYGDGQSSYYNKRVGGSVECSGYENSRHSSQIFVLEGSRTLETSRTIGQPPDVPATTRPPAHWQHITAGLQCRRGPGMILVQCRDRHGSFALSAHSWTGQEFECSVLTGICGMYTVGSPSGQPCDTNGGATLGGTTCVQNNEKARPRAPAVAEEAQRRLVALHDRERRPSRRYEVVGPAQASITPSCTKHATICSTAAAPFNSGFILTVSRSSSANTTGRIKPVAIPPSRQHPADTAAARSIKRQSTIAVGRGTTSGPPAGTGAPV